MRYTTWADCGIDFAKSHLVKGTKRTAACGAQDNGTTGQRDVWRTHYLLPRPEERVAMMYSIYQLYTPGLEWLGLTQELLLDSNVIFMS